MGLLNNGHYVAHAKINNNWYKFNDTTINKVK